MGSVDVAERFVSRIWSGGLLDGRRLVTSRGDRVRVINPGRENRDQGPDFVGATIATADHGMLTGDVELHLRASDWKRHGHHLDPNYNRVVLHVVWLGDTAANLENGRMVPTVPLRRCLSGSLQDMHWCSLIPNGAVEPCTAAAQKLGAAELGLVLDDAGDRRFRLRVDRLRGEMATEEPSEVLYRSIMAALGYSKNGAAFEELARQLPLAKLEARCRGEEPPEQLRVLAALLLGKAGLLEEHGDAALRRIWLGSGERTSTVPHRWRLFRVRPSNHPAGRLLGAAHLLARFTGAGLVEGVVSLVASGPPGLPELERSFVVYGSGRAPQERKTLVGQGRAREIVVNVVLPFAAAWARSAGEADLWDKAFALYRIYPRAEDYGVTRRLGSLLGARGLVCSARRQQGLIYLDRHFCRQGDCMLCPVAQRLDPG
jgi:hypothetical protein